MSPWDNVTFDSKGDIACGNITCANFPSASLHQIRVTVYAPMNLAIYAVLASDPDTNLLGPFYLTEANVEPLCVRKTI